MDGLNQVKRHYRTANRHQGTSSTYNVNATELIESNMHVESLGQGKNDRKARFSK